LLHSYEVLLYMTLTQYRCALPLHFVLVVFD